MEATDYSTCQKLDDSQLLDLILSGDINASFFLICVRYQQKLYGLIHKYLKKFHSKLLDNTEQEYWLYEFQRYMNSPTKITGKNRFKEIKHIDDIKSWLCQCCKNFMYDRKKNDIDLETFNINNYDTYSEMEEQSQTMLKRKMLYYFSVSLSVRDTYIVYSYLYCIEKEITIVRMDKKLTDVLIEHGCPNMTAEHIRKIKNKSFVKANKFFDNHEIVFGDIFVLLIETAVKVKTEKNSRTEKYFVDVDKNSSYKDVLIKKREAVMLSLGIERDFLTDVIPESGQKI
jgi:hypothetical protein